MAVPPFPDQNVPLNFSEHAYVAFDGVMGSMPQPYLLRFGAPLDTDQVRTVARELISANPRMRGIAEPGWREYHLHILPDDSGVVDQLFEMAWRVDDHVDALDNTALECLHNRLLNEVLPLERGLLCRFVFIPHARTPVLFIAVHHIVGDGRTMIHLVTELVKRLNGGPAMAVQPVESAQMVGAFAPDHWWQWPLQVWRSRAHVVRQKKQLRALHVKVCPREPQPYLSTHGLRHYTVPVRASALRPMARQLGLSLNSLITLAITETFLAQSPNDPQAAAVVRQSVDVRKYYPASRGYGPLWGNHVGAFLVIEQGRKSLNERAASIKAQIDEGLARFTRREMFWTYAFNESFRWMGRTLLAHIVTYMQRTMKIAAISCHATSLGNVGSMNPPDARAPVIEFIPAVPSVSLLQVVSELDDRITMPVVWQRSETSQAQVDDYLARLSQTFVQLAEAGATNKQAAQPESWAA
jgi:hypothetical protein